MVSHRARIALRALAFFAAYLAATRLLYGQDVFRQAVLWLPTGVSVAGLWVLGWHWWPLITTATLLHRALLGYPLSTGLFAAVGNTLEALTAVEILRRLRFRGDIARLQDALALLAAAALAPVVSATIGRTGWFLRGERFDLLVAWSGWWRMNALGLLVVVPPLLAWTQGPRPRPNWRTLLEIGLLATATVGLGSFLISIDPANDQSGMVLSYLALPIALYAAVRFGVRGGVTAAALVVILVTFGAAHHIGPFVAAPSVESPSYVREYALQALIAIVMATPMLLGAVITERETALAAGRRLEEQLRQTQKMEALGKLAGGVAHDFNNLLTVIGGYAEMLEAALPQPSPAHTSAEEIGRATSRAASLTRQLLAYSRQQRLDLQVLDLREIVDRLGGMLGRVIGEDIRLETRHAPEPLLVRVDRGQIEQVILNLVINARDAMPGGGTLTLTTRPCAGEDLPAGAPLPAPPDGQVELSVADTGSGMTPEVLNQAFDPFFTTKGPGKGTGLGLSTVYGTVRQSGGAVWLESAPGVGTTVRVCLPRVARPVAGRTRGARSPDTGAAQGRVLVVEDESLVRALVARTLREAGYVVEEAKDGVECLEIARGNPAPIDLVITDVIMPRMGGGELAARLAVERPGLPLVFMSGYVGAATDPPDPAGPIGPDVQYLQKPFTPTALLECVRKALAAPSSTAGPGISPPST